MGQAAIMAHPAATMGLEATMGQEATTGQAVITGMAAIMGTEAIMDTAAGTGMETLTVSASGSSQDGADGDQGGGVLQPTPIIHTTRTIQRHRLLSNKRPRPMFSRISRSPGIGTTVRIRRATTPTLNPARADG
jgi:hypothetical protein